MVCAFRRILLKRELETKLNLSCRTGAENLPEVRCKGKAIGKVKIRRVEEIEGLDPKLQALRFIEPEVSRRRQIKVLHTWANHNVASAIPKSPERRRYERRRIKEPIDSSIWANRLYLLRCICCQRLISRGPRLSDTCRKN